MAGEGASEAAPGGSISSADYGRLASFLAIGVGLTGVITYVYFFVASHVLSRPDYGQITVLWSAVFITISTLYRPIEQLLSRHISEHRVKGEPIGEAMRVAVTIQLGLGMAFAVLALALRGPLQDNLLEGNETLYWIFFSAVLFYAASYFARGFLAGSRRFGLFTALILSESVFRTSFAVLVAVGLLSRPVGGGDRHRRGALAFAHRGAVRVSAPGTAADPGGRNALAARARGRGSR